MEAKDTLVHSTSIWVGTAGNTSIREQLLTQAEISFRAGIKEVVEWLQTKREGGYNLCIKTSLAEWQAKLKEWGME